MARLKIGLIFGGKSGEHEVSLVSARSVYEALDKNKYEIKLIGIDKNGSWHFGDPRIGGEKIWIGKKGVGKLKLNKKFPVVAAISEKNKIYLIDIKNGKKLTTVDVFFPLTHGTFGEDGCLQGFLELLGAAYVGPGVLASAAGMDKDLMKRLLRENGLNTAKYLAFKNREKCDLSRITAKLGWPVFVKPANLGSSVGISKAGNAQELKKAVKAAFEYDNKIIIEEAIQGREIECSVLGNDSPVASLPGEIKLKPGHFYSYRAKYIADDIAEPVPDAKLPKKLIKKIQKAAIGTYDILGCEGMARVDFFLTAEGEIFVNEINTLPGFTSISMYPKMFERSGIPYQELLDRLIQLALERQKRNAKLRRSC